MTINLYISLLIVLVPSWWRLVKNNTDGFYRSQQPWCNPKEDYSIFNPTVTPSARIRREGIYDFSD